MYRIGAMVIGLAMLVAGCTAGGSGAAAPTITTVTTHTITRSPSVANVAPVSSGPTTAANAASCPLISEEAAHLKVGMRLDRIAVLRSGGAVVGCRFYPLGHPTAECDQTCFDGERLPPPTQPAIEITTQRYPSALDAHNAFVLLAKKGTNIQQDEMAPGNTGLCFQTTFYPKDAGQDWACTYSVGTRLVLVKTTVTSPAKNAVYVAQAIAPKF